MKKQILGLIMNKFFSPHPIKCLILALKILEKIKSSSHC